MAKPKTSGSGSNKVSFSNRLKGGTTVGNGSIKFGTMNKNKRRSFKAYRGQGKP